MPSNAETIINESNIDDVFESVYIKIKSNIQKSLGNGWTWITDSVVDHNINISKYKTLSGSSYIKLPKEFDHPEKDLINIRNINDNKCFKWYLIRCLHPADHHAARTRNVDKDFDK